MDPIDQKPTFLQKYKFTLISLLVIILAAIPLLLLSNTSSKQAPKAVTKQASVSPTAAPLTAANAEPTLTQVDADMQSALNQVDLDLQNVSSIDTTKDSSSGL